MFTYDDRDSGTDRAIPWPYNNNNTELIIKDTETGLGKKKDRQRWYTFLHSDSYEKDCQDFKRIQEMGDMNALVLFVAHHPFVPQALITLGMMLYQVNHQAQEALTFLRRAQS